MDNKTEQNQEDTLDATAAPADDKPVAVDAVEEWKTKVAYLAAEIENMRKRFAREKGEVIKFANEDLLKAVLPVMDNLQYAVKAAQDADQNAKEHPAFASLLKGVELTLKHFEQTLDRVGVKAVEAVGKPFDPTVHEALGQSQDSEVANDHVSSEMQKGYTLHGKLIRPARVIVNRNSNSSGEGA